MLLEPPSWTLALESVGKNSHCRSRGTDWWRWGTWNCGQLQDEIILPTPCPCFRGGGLRNLGLWALKLSDQLRWWLCPLCPVLLPARHRQVSPTRQDFAWGSSRITSRCTNSKCFFLATCCGPLTCCELRVPGSPSWTLRKALESTVLRNSCVNAIRYDQYLAELPDIWSW